MVSNKTLICITIAGITTTLYTSVTNAANGIDLLTASTPLIDSARLIMIVMLVTLLVTKPPRALVLRAILGVSALAISGMSLVMFFEYQIGILDIMFAVLASIIMAIDALENDRLLIPKIAHRIVV